MKIKVDRPWKIRFPFFPALILICAAWGIWSAKAEENPPAKEREKILSEPAYGNYWGAHLPYGDVPGSLGYMFLDLRTLFDYEREKWTERYGRRNPFASSMNPKTAEVLWFFQWAQATCRRLSKLGWKLEAVENGVYMFSRKTPLPGNMPSVFNKYADRPPVMPEALLPSSHSVTLPFPKLSVYRPQGNAFELHVKSKYGMPLLIIPPWARSLRIYCTVPLDASWFRFKKCMPWLHIPEIGSHLFRIGYDGGRFNVIRIDFTGDESGGIFDRSYWDWRGFQIHLRAITKIGEERFPGMPIFAWEFLDEDGKPLPADLPIATRWFPDNFEEIFKPIPLPEELKNLPEAQD